MSKNKKLKRLFVLMTLSAIMTTTSFTTTLHAEGLVPKTPADVIDFSTWKLQMPLPNDTETGVKEIKSDEMMAGYDDGKYLYLADDGAVVFHSPVDGFKTANTNYTRSELREMLDGESKLSNWGFVGTHTLTTTQSVSQVPSNGRVIVSQIHAIYPNGDNGPVPIKVEYDGLEERINIKFKTSTAPNGADANFYFDDVELNQKFDTEIKVVGGVGYVTITTEGRTEYFSYDFVGKDPNWTNYLNYFKAGSYVQDSVADYEGEAATVHIYELTTFHDDAFIEDIAIENIGLTVSSVELGLAETTPLTPVYTPIDTLNKGVTYEVVEGMENVAVNKNGVITAIKEGNAVVRVTSKDNPEVTTDCKITVVDKPAQEVLPLYAQDFGTETPSELTGEEFLVSEGGTTRVEVVTEDGNNMLQITDNDVEGNGKILIYFPEQRDTTTISYRIRLDSVDVKDADGAKAQGSYLYAPIGGKEGFMSTADEMFRLRNASSYQAGELSDHNWVLTNGYLTPEINPEAAQVELGEWLDVTIITTPNNGTADANTSDVYMNGIKVAHKMPNNNKTSEYVNQLEFYSGTKDLLSFSVDDIKVYSGAKVPESINSTLPSEILLGAMPETLGTGDSFTIEASVLPNGAQEGLTYTVIESDTLAVSKDGLVTAIKPGTGVVRVASVNDASIYSDYKLTIIDDEAMKRVEGITLPADSVSVKMGETLALGAVITPVDATEVGLKYDILSGAECLTIDQLGVVTAVQTGAATIRISSLENPTIFEDCSVKIISNKPVGEMIYEQNFDSGLDIENWTTATSNINNTENVVKDGAFYFKDNSTGGQPKAYLTFEPQADTFTIAFRFKLDADPIYNETKISALSSAFGTGSITSSANEAFRFKTAGTVENGEVVNRRFTYSRPEGVSGFDSVPNYIEAGVWYDVAFTTTPDNGSEKANTTDIYINGEKLVEGAENKLTMTTIDKFIFQTGTNDLTEYWVDDFKIWTGDYTDLEK